MSEAKHTPGPRTDLVAAARYFLKAADALINAQTVMRRTDGWRSGPGTRRSRILDRHEAADKAYDEAAKALRAALARAEGRGQ